MGYKLNGKLLGTLIDEVIYPVEKKLVADIQLSDEDATKMLQKVGFLKLSIAPFKKDVILDDEMYYMEKIYQLPLEKGYIQELLGYFSELYKHWFEKHCNKKSITIDRFNAIMDLLQKMKSVDNSNEDLNTSYDEEFFDFDADFDDTEINTMHYSESQKISAVEFMQRDAIDPDIVAEMQELLELYEESTLKCEELQDECIEAMAEIVRKFASLFELSGEFRDLAKSMNLLLDVLGLIGDTQKLKVESKEVIKLLLDAVMEDLQKWFETVIVTQTTDDIHYLDASLLSSVEQIRILVVDISGGG